MATLDETYGSICPRLDQDHRILFSIMERLDAYLAAPPDSKAIDALATELIAYFDTHFKNEEAVMEQAGYPDLEAHRREHAATSQRYRDIAILMREDPWTARGVLVSLKEWWINHIGRADRQLAEYLKSRTAG